METVIRPHEAPIVTLELEGPRRQRRWTVAFRLILVVPHLLYLAVLSVALFFAVVGAWFAALVTGRMPDGLGTFIARVTQYMGRVYAYGPLLLTDRYPSFALDEPDYPVSVRAPYGGRLNRAAVLFRIFLVIPAQVAQWLVWTGLSVCLAFIWLIVLIAGRPPQALFEAEAAALRYLLRVYSYFAMLTSEYPRGLFGDKGLSTDEEPTAPGVPTAPSEPAPFVAEAVPQAAAPPPRVTKLVLSKAAKRLVALFIALGALFGIAMVVVTASLSDIGEAREELNAAYEEIYEASLEYGTAVQDCAVRQAGLECLQGAAADLQAAFGEFRAALREVDMPPPALGAARQVDEDAQAVVDLLGELSRLPDPATYAARTAELQQALQRFDQDSRELDTALFGY